MVLFQRPKLISLDQPLSPRVQLLSMEQLYKSLPFTTVLEKWKQKNTTLLVPNVRLFWSLNSAANTLPTYFVFTCSHCLFPSVDRRYISRAWMVCTKMMKPECCRNTPFLFSRLCPMVSERLFSNFLHF